MKTTTLFSPITLVIVACMLFAVACVGPSQEGQAQPTDTAESDLPALLVRSSLLGSDQEQQYMKNTYRQLQRQIQEHPDDPEAYLKMTRLFILEARTTGEHGHYYPAALKMLNTVLEKDLQEAEKFEALFLKATVTLSLHKFEEALALIEEALPMNPHFAQIHGALTDAHVELGNYDAAVKAADQMVAIRPDLRSYARVSYLREIHGDYVGAIEAMKLAVSAGVPGQEDAAWTRLTLGNLYATYGDLEQAAAMYTQVLAERPNYPFAWAALAEIAVKKENTQAADSLLQLAIDAIPEVGFYEQLAHVYRDMGRTQEAKELVNEILLMLQDDEENGHQMGMEYAVVYRDLIQDQDQALHYALTEYEKRPNNMEVNQLLASIYLLQGNLAEAENHRLAALSTGARDPELLMISGLIQTKNGDSRNGRKHIRQSLELNPYQQDSFATQGRALLTQ